MSTTTSKQMEALEQVKALFPETAPLPQAAERMVEWGGGLLAAVKGAAVGDHA